MMRAVVLFGALAAFAGIVSADCGVEPTTSPTANTAPNFNEVTQRETPLLIDVTRLGNFDATQDWEVTSVTTPSHGTAEIYFLGSQPGFNIATFTGAEGDLRLYGNAQVTPAGHLQLTNNQQSQRGFAYYDRMMDIVDFEIEMTFAISNPSNPPADGFSLIIHNDPAGLGAQGEHGGGLGYHGLTRCIAVEFDTFQNGFAGASDPAQPHISVHTRGDLANNADEQYSLGRVLMPSLTNGADHLVRVKYSTGRLEVFFDGPRVLDIAVNIPGIITLQDTTKGWVAVAASTGALYEKHLVKTWRLTNNFRGANRVRYTPASCHVGCDSFSYTIANAAGASSTGQIAVTTQGASCTTGTTGTTSTGTTGTSGTTSTGTTGTTGTTSTGTTGTTGTTSTGTTGTTGTTSTGTTGTTGTTSTGTTSTGVPVPLCPARPAPLHGSASSTSLALVGTVVTFSCDGGYALAWPEEPKGRDGDHDDDDHDDHDHDRDGDDHDDRRKRTNNGGGDDRDDHGGDRDHGDHDDDDHDRHCRNKRTGSHDGGHGDDDCDGFDSVCRPPWRAGSLIGRWSSPVPVCVPIKNYCPSRADPRNGDARSTGPYGPREIGSVVTYTCDSGFDLSGAASATCVAGGAEAGSGVWSAPAPTCLPRGTGCVRDGLSSNWRCSGCLSRDVRCYTSYGTTRCNRDGHSDNYRCTCATGHDAVCFASAGGASIEQEAQSDDVGGVTAVVTATLGTANTVFIAVGLAALVAVAAVVGVVVRRKRAAAASKVCAVAKLPGEGSDDIELDLVDSSELKPTPGAAAPV